MPSIGLLRLTGGGGGGSQHHNNGRRRSSVQASDVHAAVASMHAPPRSNSAPSSSRVSESRRGSQTGDDGAFRVLPAEVIEAIFIAAVLLPYRANSGSDSSHDPAQARTNNAAQRRRGSNSVANIDSRDVDSGPSRRSRAKPNLAVSAVCRRWRSIATRCVLLWQRIEPNDLDTERFNWTRLCLSRSGSTCLLDISFRWRVQPPSPASNSRSQPAARHVVGLPGGGTAYAPAGDRRGERSAAAPGSAPFDDKDAALALMRLLLPHASRWRSFHAEVAHRGALQSILQSIAHLATTPRLEHLALVRPSADVGARGGGNSQLVWNGQMFVPNAESEDVPSLGRFLRTSPRLTSLAMWNCVEGIQWPSSSPPSSPSPSSSSNVSPSSSTQHQQQSSIQPRHQHNNITRLSIASSSHPVIQRQMIASSASHLVQLVLMLGAPNAGYVENVGLPPIDLPALRQLVLIGPLPTRGREAGGGGGNQNARIPPRLLAGLLRVPSLHTLEFHGCDADTLDSFVGVNGGRNGAGVGVTVTGNANPDGMESMMPKKDEFPDVRRLVIVGVPPVLSSPPQSPNSPSFPHYAQPQHYPQPPQHQHALSSALHGLPGVTDLILRFAPLYPTSSALSDAYASRYGYGVRDGANGVHGASVAYGHAVPPYGSSGSGSGLGDVGVDVSSCLLPASSLSSSDPVSSSSSSMPLPRLRRLEIEGVSLEHLTRVLKARKKYGQPQPQSHSQSQSYSLSHSSSSGSGTRPTPLSTSQTRHMRTSLISGLGLGPGPGEESEAPRTGAGMRMGMHSGAEETPVPALSKLIVRLPPREPTAPYPYGYPGSGTGTATGIEGEDIEGLDARYGGSSSSNSSSRASPEAKLAALVGKLEIRRPSASGGLGNGSGFYDQVEGEYRMPWFD